MNPRALISLLFKEARTPTGRIIVGILLAGCITYLGLSGFINGEVWVPSSGASSDGMKFGRYAGMSASLCYIFLGILCHYVGFWLKGRLEEARGDVAVLIFSIACAASAIGFIILSLLDI